MYLKYIKTIYIVLTLSRDKSVQFLNQLLKSILAMESRSSRMTNGRCENLVSLVFRLVNGSPAHDNIIEPMRENLSLSLFFISCSQGTRGPQIKFIELLLLLILFLGRRNRRHPHPRP